jgi:hypothetical protein
MALDAGVLPYNITIIDSGPGLSNPWKTFTIIFVTVLVCILVCFIVTGTAGELLPRFDDPSKRPPPRRTRNRRRMTDDAGKFPGTDVEAVSGNKLELMPLAPIAEEAESEVQAAVSVAKGRFIDRHPSMRGPKAEPEAGPSKAAKKLSHQELPPLTIPDAPHVVPYPVTANKEDVSPLCSSASDSEADAKDIGKTVVSPPRADAVSPLQDESPFCV